MLARVAAIERLLGRAEGLTAPVAQPLLRKRNRVRTIRGSVGIEGNTLGEDQVTALLDGKRVIGSAREIREVENANRAHDLAPRWRSGSERHFRAAHAVMMKGLTVPAGRYRTSEVGIVHGARVAHVAPPARRVPALMRELFGWLRTTETPALVRSCVAHYEILFIHPFTDGNGRMARLWQHVTLLESSSIFRIVPVESVIRERQRAYYDVLARCDRRGSSTEFVELVLTALHDALAETLAELRPARVTGASRLTAAREHFGARWFRRAEYLGLHRAISTATASRDLREGVASRALERRGDRRLAEYRFRRNTQ